MGIINIAQQLSALSVIFLYNNVSYVLTFSITDYPIGAYIIHMFIHFVINYFINIHHGKDVTV